MTGLGLTKYGFIVDYGVDADTRVNRTYNGINFSSDTAANKAQQLALIVKGYFDGSSGRVFAEGNLADIVDSLGMTGINGVELVQRNTVIDDA